MVEVYPKVDTGSDPSGHRPNRLVTDLGGTFCPCTLREKHNCRVEYGLRWWLELVKNSDWLWFFSLSLQTTLPVKRLVGVVSEGQGWVKSKVAITLTLALIATVERWRRSMVARRFWERKI
ncbi:hypothetical protein V6N11_055337 [Hibiscus sabdariffa]|uniref:Uncharacterized protein n=2 Tax=Hibiscus sabdariffa TaxID=183260 RepID=A0ABR2PEZ1_9ROSI